MRLAAKRAFASPSVIKPTEGGSVIPNALLRRWYNTWVMAGLLDFFQLYWFRKYPAFSIYIFSDVELWYGSLTQLCFCGFLLQFRKIEFHVRHLAYISHCCWRIRDRKYYGSSMDLEQLWENGMFSCLRS
jgi:hypothetical protein